MLLSSLLDWLRHLLNDPAEQAAFQANPQGYLEDHGFGDASPADVHEALCLLADDNDHDGWRSYDHDSDHDGHFAPPDDYSHHESAAHYLNNYVNNNYTVVNDDGTYIDDSVHERVDTHGGDFNQNIDNDPVVASGHGVAAGHDIRDSNIATGNHDVVGHDNNVVDGDHNTTAFGSGNATNTDLSDSHFGSGSAVSIGGDSTADASQHNTNTLVHGGDGPTSVNVAGEHGQADQYSDQHHSDTSIHSNYEDNAHTNIHDDYNSHNNADIDDSHHTQVFH
ncbi:MAG: IniB N-terminal domain-containing protein [Pseudonocardia sp.]|nr:IniB N-terminal domain-containing protein [Pseudonocardia sp.]